ncbi:MAG: Cys-Gln thioester bond-forming surface protein, partial [Firmicutes bacterium]|nr:Cys-Gln thioester bond-forming surface protein [Bacillota bacterium]
VYQGTGNTSKFVPAVVFTEPMTAEQKVEKWGDYAYIKKGQSNWKTFLSWLDADYAATIAKDENGEYILDEEGFITDVNGKRILRQEQTAKDPNGNTVYLHRIDANGAGNNVEGWYEGGQWVEELNGAKYGAVWAGAQQFVLVDSKTGEVVTTYCADINDPTEKDYGYNMVNLEDAGYYTEEQAKRIRTIASKGYWGTDSEYGSLEAMKAQLLDSGLFTAEELKSLTDGVALTATQMAIWSCSNHMAGVQFINSHFIKKDDLTATEISGIKSNGVPYSTTDYKHNVPEAKEDEVVLMFKVYEYLKNLDGTEVANDTSETIINDKNFIKNLCVSVIDKVTGHANNKDDIKNNDAYTTNITFALEVKPAEGNNDELVVTVKTADGKSYIGRIAGTAKEGEVQLVADENGNYSFSGITMIEGKQNFNITLEGVQNLKEGVYLYTSEVRGTETSQTMVGVASGKRDVNVTMDIVFELNVDDEVISKERVWHDEGDPGVNVPPAVFAVHRPLENIPEEEVPLADAPQTGDEAIVFAALTLLAGISLMAMHVSEKKRKEEI